MGLSPIPSGGILFRDQSYLDAMSVDSPYLTIKNQSTIVGTRLGASSAATFAIMKYFGKEGYSNNAKLAMEKTEFLALLLPIAITILSNIGKARRTTDSCPFVIGSKLPGNKAILSFI